MRSQIILIREVPSNRPPYSYRNNTLKNSNFRYVIIHETFGKSQSKSQTRDVSIYNIKPINGLPPIQIIDTPGFGDTGGIKQDMIITSKIEKAFKKELNSYPALIVFEDGKISKILQSNTDKSLKISQAKQFLDMYKTGE